MTLLRPWRVFGALGLILLGSGGALAAGAPVTDCPLARQPYSIDTPIIDIMLDPAARAVVDRDVPGVLGRLPALFVSTKPPSFAAIFASRQLLTMAKVPADQLATLDRDLATVPITPAATIARCARYDAVPPTLPAPRRHPALLVFDKINGFRDAPSVDAATAALKAMAERRGWDLTFTDNAAVFNAKQLARYDAVIWNNISGDALTVPQRQAFKNYITHGGGFAGFHGTAGDPIYIWDWYVDTLIGARFIGHTMDPQFQEARVVIDDPKSKIVRGLGDGWSMIEEWYSFEASPRLTGAHVLARLDESSYSPKGFGRDLSMGDHPIAWTRCIDKGRSFYSAIGHRPENYSEPHSVKLLEQGIEWAAGRGATRCAAGHEVAR